MGGRVSSVVSVWGLSFPYWNFHPPPPNRPGSGPRARGLSVRSDEHGGGDPWLRRRLFDRLHPASEQRELGRRLRHYGRHLLRRLALLRHLRPG